MWEQARLLALVDAAMADGYISSFDTKFHYLFWRPVTAIREADADGNPATSGDPRWTPLIVTPPIPDYDSAHAVEGAAAARVMSRVLGTDRVPFTLCSLTLAVGQTCDDAKPVTRSYTRLSQAAAENGESRILVGIHFRLAVERGLARGTKIADYTVSRMLRPMNG